MHIAWETGKGNLSQRLEKIMRKYPFKVNSIMPVRDVYLVQTENGPKCLKHVDYGEEELLFTYKVMQHLWDNGFRRIAPFIPTKDGEPWVNADGELYFLTDWILGRECNFLNPVELKLAVRTLAEFHLYAKKFDPLPKSSWREEWGVWPARWEKRTDELLKMKRAILQREKRDSFDELFLQYVDRYYLQGLCACQSLAKSCYKDLVEKGRQEKTFCHHDYTYHNILVQDKEQCFLIDFDYCCFEIHAYDVGDLILRNLRRSGWNLQKVRFILDNYSAVRPLGRDEIEVIFAMCQFPQNFWRAADNYYCQPHKYSKEYYFRDLMRIVQQYDEQEKLLNLLRLELRQK